MGDEERPTETYGYPRTRQVTDVGGDGWFATPGGPDAWDVFSLTQRRRVLKDLSRELAMMLVDDHNAAEERRQDRPISIDEHRSRSVRPAA